VIPGAIADDRALMCRRADAFVDKNLGTGKSSGDTGGVDFDMNGLGWRLIRGGSEQ
jgi:hypothetical protein